MKIKPRVLRHGLEHEVKELREWGEEIGNKSSLDKVLQKYLNQATGYLNEMCELLKRVEQGRKEI